jgi:hypothetical protein
MPVIGRAFHIEALNKNTSEVQRLIEIHTAVAGHGPGRKHDVEVLNKSGLVLLCACWEAYVEDLAAAAITQLIKRVRSHEQIPVRVRTNITEALVAEKDRRKLWELAGDGWKSVLEQHGIKRINAFHAPHTKNVDELLMRTIGAPDVSASWRWKGMSASKAKRALDKLVELRGGVAHRVGAAEHIGKRRMSRAIGFVERLATRSHNHVHTHLRKCTGEEIWPRFSYGSIDWMSE